MPYDLSGESLKIGDQVNIPCTVKAVRTTENQEDCNITVETDAKMFPNIYKITLDIQSKQVVKTQY